MLGIRLFVLRLFMVELPALAHGSSNATPVILDTDMGNDIDDALALVMLHTLQSSGECEILGITLSKDNPWAAIYTEQVNRFYGRPQIPIGAVQRGATPDEGPFIRRIPELFGEKCFSRKPDDAVTLLRRMLSSQPDQSVVILTIGFLTNMSRLLNSLPDADSPLDGMELFSRKVNRVCSMAGSFRPGKAVGPDSGNPEYNIRTDIPAARSFFGRCPRPVVFSGFEVGAAIVFPGAFIEKALAENPGNPVAAAYAAYLPMPYDRPCWDQSAVLQAIRPNAGYFRLSDPGCVTVDSSGQSGFINDPDGLHRYLILDEENVPRIRREILDLCSMGSHLTAQPKIVSKDLFLQL